MVSSPAVVKSIDLEEFLQLSPKKQRQYEGGFLSCKTIVEVDNTETTIAKKEKPSKKIKKKKVCKPTNVIDELLEEIDYIIDTKPEKASEYKAVAQNLIQRERFLDRQSLEMKLGQQPEIIYFGCALLASCVATLIMHPLDTLKVRLMSGKTSEKDEKESSSDTNSILGLYDGILPNLLKEGPASAFYLGVYEIAKTSLLTNFPSLESNILLVYLLAGSIGELAGSVLRSPAEAVKTRVQAGLFDVPSAVQNVFFTKEGRKNTFFAWSAGVFRDVPHGAILIATFEITKVWIVDSSWDIDVNTLLSEAVLGGLGGGLGALVSTPSDVITTKIITDIEKGGDPPLPQDMVMEVWNKDGIKGLFAGVSERVGYWTLSYGIFLSVYCSLRQFALVLFQ